MNHRKPRAGKTIYVIPDTQVKPGVKLDYLAAIGHHILDKRPDVVVHLGDHWDMPSLSSYDKGKKSFEGRRYIKDVQAGINGMEALLGPIRDHNATACRAEAYKPRLVFCMGNHEQRIERAIDNASELEGAIGYQDLKLAEYGWEVFDFQVPVVIEGVVFCHFLTSGAMGRPVGTAQALLNKKHMSCVVGHQQGFQVATTYRGDGKRLCAIIAGSSYTHDEGYLGPQGNRHWRGTLLLHAVRDGEFIEQVCTIGHVMAKYQDKL